MFSKPLVHLEGGNFIPFLPSIPPPMMVDQDYTHLNFRSDLALNCTNEKWVSYYNVIVCRVVGCQLVGFS